MLDTVAAIKRWEFKSEHMCLRGMVKNMCTGDWRDGSALKGTGCSTRGPEFSYICEHMVAHNCQ